MAHFQNQQGCTMGELVSLGFTIFCQKAINITSNVWTIGDMFETTLKIKIRFQSRFFFHWNSHKHPDYIYICTATQLWKETGLSKKQLSIVIIALSKCHMQYSTTFCIESFKMYTLVWSLHVSVFSLWVLWLPPKTCSYLGQVNWWF